MKGQSVPDKEQYCDVTKTHTLKALLFGHLSYGHHRTLLHSSNIHYLW